MGDPSWDRLLKAYDNDEVVHGKATKVVEGGSLVDVGVSTFLPAELAHVRPAYDPSSILGRWVGCRILDRRSVMVEERWEERRRVLESIEEG